MFEAARLTGYSPHITGIQPERPPALQGLAFEAMMLEALGEDAEQPAAGSEGAGFPDFSGLLASEPLISTTRSNVAMVPGEAALKRVAVNGGNAPANASRAYTAAAAPVAAPAPQELTSSPKLHRLVEWMDGHALTRSMHKCARFVRQAFEAAGISTSDRPASGAAGDYGPYLVRHGAQPVETGERYRPQAGDTAVFEKTAEHPYGHIEVFDGERWVSDFRQKGFSPYGDAATTPGFQVYRLPYS